MQPRVGSGKERGAVVEVDGVGRCPSLLVNGAATFPIDTSPHRDTFPLWTRVYSTTLTSWGSGFVGRDLLNL